MKIEVELPEDTICGFVNYIRGDMISGLSLGNLSLGSNEINSSAVSYKKTKGIVRG